MKEDPSSLNLSSAGFTLDEVCMRQRLCFSESLKDLKDLKSQLYSAAQHFEQSYSQHDRKHMVMSKVKEYTAKALVNSVDHLGSLAYKVDALLNEKIEDFSANELRISCLHHGIRICRENVTGEGVSQQSFSLASPNHHKRYVLPEVAKRESNGTSPSVVGSCLSPSIPRRASFPASPFSFGSKSSNRKSGKRSSSPLSFLVRSGSLKDSSTSPTSTPTASKARWSQSEPRRWSTTFKRAETDAATGDIQLYSIRNRCLFEALLSIRRSKK